VWFKISYLHTTFAVLIYRIMDFHMCQKLLHLSVLSPKGKPILNGTIKNIIVLQNFETHPTSKQHKIHSSKTFHFKLYIKRFPKSCRIWNFNGCIKFWILIFQMNGQEKRFKKITQKEHVFHFLKMILILRRPQIFLFLK